MPVLLLFALSLSQVATGSAGVVTSASGHVRIVQGDATRLAAAGSEVSVGDRIETSEGSIAGLFLDEGTLVLLAPNTLVTISASLPARELKVGRGEIRVTSSGNAGAYVRTPQATAGLPSGIVRVAVDSRGTIVSSEEGTANLVSRGAPSLGLDAGTQTVINPSGGVQSVTAHDPKTWTIVPARYVAGQASARGRKTFDPGLQRASEEYEQDPAPPRTPSAPATQPPSTPPVTPRPGAAASVGEPSEPVEPTAPATRAATDTAAPAPGSGLSFRRSARTNVDSRSFSTSGIQLALGNTSATLSAGGSGGLFSDAQQDSLKREFAGNVHLITTDTQYRFKDVKLRPGDGFLPPGGLTNAFWSIGLGDQPTSQVVTNFRTATNATPTTLKIPGASAYLVRYDQYGIPDPATNPPPSVDLGIAGLLGATPTSPQIVGATPLTDQRSVFNPGATFALGEFQVTQEGMNPRFDVRRSDQDRQIIPGFDANGNRVDQLDQVTPNPEIQFKDARDPIFFPEAPSVKVPVANTYVPQPTYSSVNLLRKAGLTTLVADQLKGYSRRTGQTRFVVDGKIVDITGYNPPRPGAAPLRGSSLLRSSDLARGGNSTASGPRTVPNQRQARAAK